MMTWRFGNSFDKKLDPRKIMDDQSCKPVSLKSGFSFHLPSSNPALDCSSLTMQEFVLTTLVYYLVAETPPPKSNAGPTSSSTGAGSSGTAGTSSGGSTGSTAQQGGVFAGTTGGNGSRRHGTPSSTYERLLLAHLHAYLPHRQYEVARAQESRASLFLTRLLGSHVDHEQGKHDGIYFDTVYCSNILPGFIRCW